jgi:AcrR family transcriptional regulator
MKNYTKGVNSKEFIINSARELFNEHGIGITLSVLAGKMEITLGMLTYHFPTKDSIFLAIAEEYEQKRASQRVRDYTGKFNLVAFYQIIEKVMDLQYDYRCAMRYIASISNNQSKLANHTIDHYRINRQLINQVTQFFVSQGELKSDILEEKKFEVFLFAFSSLLTSWLINLEIYDYEVPYLEMKPVYLNGIFSIFLPYCTELGKEILKEFGIS